MIGSSLTRSLPTRPPELGDLVEVRSRRWLVEEVVEPGFPGQSPIVRLACADDSNQGQTLDVFWDYEPDRRILEEEMWRDLAVKDSIRRVLLGLSAYPPLELRHRHRSAALPVAVPRRHPDRRLPARAAAQGAAAAARQPVHRRRRGPGQDHRGRPDCPRAAAAQEGRDIVVAGRRRCSQWQDELENRFGLTFVILDKDYIAGCVASAATA